MNSIYLLYRACSNIEAGGILFEDAPTIWLETRGAAAAIFRHTCEKFQQCVLNDYKFIRRNEHCIFSSGYVWSVSLFEFKRRKSEAVDAAKDRVLRRLSAARDKDVKWLEASLIAHDGEYWEPGLSEKGQPDISAIEAEPLVEEVADYLAG